MRKKGGTGGIHAESEPYKEKLLEKIRVMAEACHDTDRIREEMELAPFDSVVKKIWRERLDEVTEAEMRERIGEMSFEEIFSARHSRPICELKNTSNFLTERIVEMFDSYACRSSFGAYQFYVASSIFTIGDLTFKFENKSIELAESESSGFREFIDIVRAYRVEAGKYVQKPISRKDRGIPYKIREIWKIYLEKLYYEHAMVHAPVCTSSMKAKRGMLRLCPLLLGGPGYEVWKRRYVELLDEEAAQEALVCDSARLAQERYSEANCEGAKRAKEVWEKRCRELAEASVQKITDRKEMRKPCRFPSQDDPAYDVYLIRYMELSIPPSNSVLCSSNLSAIIERVRAFLKKFLML